MLDSDDSEGPFGPLRKIMEEEKIRMKATKRDFYDRHTDFLSKLTLYQKTKEKPQLLKNFEYDIQYKIKAAKQNRKKMEKEKRKKD